MLSEEKRILREMAKMIKELEKNGEGPHRCSNCGNIIPVNEWYCSHCGLKVGEKPSIKVKKIMLM